MPSPVPSPHALRVSGLAQNAPTAFEIAPNTDQIKALTQTLELVSLRKVRFAGQVAGQGAQDWELTGQLGATVTQPCAVTLSPVTTRIDVPVRRLYLKDYQEIEALEAEMPEDEEIEPLAAWIDVEAVMIEALSLALPDFPRAPDAELGQLIVTEPGAAPMTDEAARPFAGLADLKSKLSQESND